MNRIFIRIALAAAGLGLAAGGYAQKSSDRPIRVIVPFEVGGTSDLLGRVVAAKLGEVMGQTAVVDNRGGAGGTIGAALVAQAAPDGHTLLVPHVGLAVNETLYPKRQYNAVRDLAPISKLGETPNSVVVNNALPVKTVQDLIALARKQPGKLNCGSAGIGSAAHLAMALLEHSAGIKFNHIPYKGGGPALIAVVSGEVDFSMPAFPTAVPHLKAGRLRIIAVTGAKRARTVPDVPTLAESGVPGYEFGIWFSLFAPAGTPRPLIARLNREMVKALAEPEMREKLAAVGVDAESSTPEQLGQHLRSEISKWAKVIKGAGIPIN
jgi:tripartite-type tricarboxylate transporter receptor subunit TctC